MYLFRASLDIGMSVIEKFLKRIGVFLHMLTKVLKDLKIFNFWKEI